VGLLEAHRGPDGVGGAAGGPLPLTISAVPLTQMQVILALNSSKGSVLGTQQENHLLEFVLSMVKLSRSRRSATSSRLSDAPERDPPPPVATIAATGVGEENGTDQIVSR
jgi:hypothetical protein